MLVIVFLFCGCKVKNYTPELTDFKQNASVTSGDFSYTCEICKNEGVVTIIATSTNAKGMCIRYDGKTASFIYDDIKLDFDGKKLDYTNPAIAVFEVFYYLQNNENINVSKVDSGFKYEGKTNLGDFVLLQNDDLSYDALVFKDANIIFDFGS